MEPLFDLDTIVEALGPKLYRYFAARFDKALADDLTQETLVRLVSKYNRGEYNNKKGSIDMWAFGIARYVRLEEIKRSSKVQMNNEDFDWVIEDNSFVEAQERRSDVDQLRCAIKDLSEPQQEIILLMINKELKLQAIADHLDMPIGTVKSHIHRAKTTLLTLFSQSEGGRNGRQI